MEMRAISLPVFAKKHPINYSPRLARGFSLLSEYQKSRFGHPIERFTNSKSTEATALVLLLLMIHRPRVELFELRCN